MFPACAVQIDLGFIIDQSTSISSAGGAGNWDFILNAVEQIIASFPIGPTRTRVGMVRFASTAELTFSFTQYSSASPLINKVSSLSLQGGETNYAGAYIVANSQMFSGRRTGVKTIAIMITDGVPNVDVENTFVPINVTKNLDIEIFAIGVGTGVSNYKAMIISKKSSI